MDKSLGISFEDTGSQSFLITEDFTNDKTIKEFSKADKSFRKTKSKVCKVRNFQKLYLELGLWPDHNPSEIRSKYYKSQQKLNSLRSSSRSSISNKENCCRNCKSIESKYKASKTALAQALDLSSILLNQLSEILPD